jgi:hypothetical protein
MGDREFIDSSGIAWKVWNTIPGEGGGFSTDVPGECLTFESMTCSLRRVAPVPENWEQLPVDFLEQLCAGASDAAPSTGEGSTIAVSAATPELRRSEDHVLDETTPASPQA